jgi:hypothetical protein
LFGANARNDDAPDAVRNQPDVETTADQRAVPTLLEDRVGRNLQRRESRHESGRFGEGAGLFDMEHLHDRNSEPLGAVDQRLLALEISVEAIDAEVGPMAERFLGVDDDQGGVGGGHFRFPSRNSRSTVAPNNLDETPSPAFVRTIRAKA